MKSAPLFFLAMTAGALAQTPPSAPDPVVVSLTAKDLDAFQRGMATTSLHVTMPDGSTHPLVDAVQVVQFLQQHPPAPPPKAPPPPAPPPPHEPPGPHEPPPPPSPSPEPAPPPPPHPEPPSDPGAGHIVTHRPAPIELPPSPK